MEKQLQDLELRIEKLEQLLDENQFAPEEMEFEIFKPEAIKLQSLTIKTTGNHRKWRETRDLRGAIKYSNWAVTVSIVNENGTAVKCDWIKLSNCNYRIKQNPIAVEASSISFTTDTGKGWDNIKFDVEIKQNGIPYNRVTINLG
ncbi:hypothetical protein INQ51_04820 [Maribellus sp. CM-23]|uniref:hypothetical protein n=1 Tax=Maribellus sp. CM-23 TaxID=2781026 RepID=UPI001F241A86|nr:hypothetical protein [Maribellus sp. CM-23]MCE4563624.1 hypothetical protein [Maribellus sp. CM-23]